MKNNPGIGIIGGGIGGLTAGLALLRKGFDVTVFEQASVLAEVLHRWLLPADLGFIPPESNPALTHCIGNPL